MKKLRKIFGSQNYSKGLTRSQQNQFAQTMGELLLSGFSLQESLYLLLTIRSFPPVILANIQHQLKEGQAFSEVLSQIGYGAEQLVQIELAERHGNLPTTLLEIAKQFRLVEGFRNDLKKLLAYPMLLLTFLLGILFSMRLFVLPQHIGSGMVMQEHWGIQLIQVFHWYVLLFILAVTLLALLVRYRLMKLSPVDQSEWISRQLLIGPIYSLCQSAYLSLEIGKLFHEGFELRQIIVCLKETKQESLIQHLASKLIQGLEAGMSLAEQFQNYRFLSEEFSKIVLQGEAKGSLGKELIFYSEWTRKQLFKRLHHWMHFIQPIIFLGVAALILLVYAAVLLPVYGSIEEVLP
ncbi:TPA: competence type IV pilus assembly protein ComGB [Enterococcus faecium]